MNCCAEGRCGPAAKDRLIARLVKTAWSLRTAARDRRVLLAMDDRMLGDIGLARGDVLQGVRVKDDAAARRATAWRFSFLTIVVVMISLAGVLVAPDGTKVDSLRVTSCALFPQGIMGASNKWVLNRRCNPPYDSCRQTAGAPKHVC